MSAQSRKLARRLAAIPAAVKQAVVPALMKSGEELAERMKHLAPKDRTDEVVGSVRAVSVDGDGLKVRGRLNMEVQRAREIRAMLIAGDISGLSIGFRRLADEPRAKGIRHITKAELVEVSFVAMPSVPGSRVTSVRVHQEPSHASAVAFVNAIRKATRSLETLK